MTVVELVGRPLPDVALPSTLGAAVNPKELRGKAMWVIYPYTGRPGVPDPKGWDAIPGAHGSTPQLLAYRNLHKEFEKLHVTICAVSKNSPSWQSEFAARNDLPFALLSCREKNFAHALGLEIFRAGDEDFLKRCTLFSLDGNITHVRQQVHPPEDDASLALAWWQAVTA